MSEAICRVAEKVLEQQKGPLREARYRTMRGRKL